MIFHFMNIFIIKNGLIRIDSTLSDLTLRKGTYITKDDLILILSNSFLY